MGTDLWTPVAVPSVGVLCSRAWWEASSESPWVFDDASRLHDLKRPSLFRRDEVPARNTHKIVRLRLYAPKKVFEGSKGRFFKNAPWQGVGRRPTKGERTIPTRHAFSGGTKSLHETPPDRPALPLCPQKVFEGSKGRFFKNAPLAGCGTASHKERASLYGRVRLFRRDEVPARNTHRQSGFAFTNQKKFLRDPRGVFSKTLLGREWDSVPQREASQPIGVRLFRRDKVLSRNTDIPSGFAFTHRKKFLRVPRGVFSKTLLGRVWDGVLQREGKSDRQTGEKA